MDLHLFGTRPVSDVDADLRKIGFTRNPDLKGCSFPAALLVTPAGQKTGFLTSVQLPPGSGNMYTVFAMHREEAHLLKTIKGYVCMVKEEEDEESRPVKRQRNSDRPVKRQRNSDEESRPVKRQRNSDEESSSSL